MGVHVSKFCLSQGDQSSGWIAEDLKLREMKIALIGNENSGKSTFIDGMRGLQSYWFVGDDDIKGILPDGVKIAQNEEIMTLSVSGRKYKSTPNRQIVWHLIPRTHFLGMAVEEFIEKFGLAQFDIVILMIDSSVLDIELLLFKLLKELGKKSFFVFSRFDQVLEQRAIQIGSYEKYKSADMEFTMAVVEDYRTYFHERTLNASIMGRKLFNEAPRVYFISSLLHKLHNFENADLMREIYTSVDKRKKTTFLVECNNRSLFWIGEKFKKAAQHVEGVGGLAYETGLFTSLDDLQIIFDNLLGILSDILDLFGINLWQIRAYLGSFLWNSADPQVAEAICTVTSVVVLFSEREVVEGALRFLFGENLSMLNLIKFIRSYLKGAIIKCRDTSVVLLVIKSQYHKEEVNNPLTPHKFIPDNLPQHLMPGEKTRSPPSCPENVLKSMMFHGVGLRDRYLETLMKFAELEKIFNTKYVQELQEGIVREGNIAADWIKPPELNLDEALNNLIRHFSLQECRYLQGSLTEFHWRMEKDS